jgi:hypothetical protein
MSVEVATEILRVEGPGGWCVIERAAVCQALSARAKSFGSLQRVLVDKAEDEGDELLGPLHPQHVTRAWSGQQLIARARDPLGDCSTCRRWGEDILLARDHERVRTDRTQPIQGVVFFLGLPLLAGRADLRLGLRASQPSSQTCRLRPHLETGSLQAVSACRGKRDPSEPQGATWTNGSGNRARGRLAFGP